MLRGKSEQRLEDMGLIYCYEMVEENRVRGDEERKWGLESQEENQSRRVKEESFKKNIVKFKLRRKKYEKIYEDFYIGGDFWRE